LWWNDPDAICLAGDLPLAEFQFHATAIYASGGMLLSGDDLTKMPPDRLDMLRRLLPPTGVAARFEDDAMNVGTVTLANARMFCCFNWDDNPRTFRFKLPGLNDVTDYWTGEKFGKREGWFTVNDVPAHAARLLKVA
jgi:alpha-galactosidase